MAAFSFADCVRYAKTCGFTLRKNGSGYHLQTCYGDYTRPTLKEITSLIAKDNRRLSSARF